MIQNTSILFLVFLLISGKVFATDWTGFYLGVGAGKDSSDSHFDDTNTVDPDPDKTDIGLHAGYRYEFTNNMVVGIAADINPGSGDARRDTFVGPTANSDLESTLGDGQSLLVSAGYAHDRLLPYLTTGVAVIEESFCTFNPVGAATCGVGNINSDDRTGWVIGGGLNYAITDSVILSFEYRYTDFGNQTYPMTGFTSGRINSKLEVHKALFYLSWKF